jgi:hypothetical protein
MRQIAIAGFVDLLVLHDVVPVYSVADEASSKQDAYVINIPDVTTIRVLELMTTIPESC